MKKILFNIFAVLTIIFFLMTVGYAENGSPICILTMVLLIASGFSFTKTYGGK